MYSVLNVYTLYETCLTPPIKKLSIDSHRLRIRKSMQTALPLCSALNIASKSVKLKFRKFKKSLETTVPLKKITFINIFSKFFEHF